MNVRDNASERTMDKQSPLKAILDQILLQRIWSKEINLSRGAFLKVEDTIDTNLYLIDEGSLRFYIRDDHDDKTIRFGYGGELVAALDSYISSKPSPLNIQAIRKTKLKVIQKKDFTELIINSKELKSAWEQILGTLLLDCMEREIDILTKSPQDRYNRVFSRSPRLFQEIPHKYIASYLNMTPETLSRIKKS